MVGVGGQASEPRARPALSIVWKEPNRRILLHLTKNLQLTTENRTTLVHVEIHAGDRPGDHIFLNLNQVAVGVRHR